MEFSSISHDIVKILPQCERNVYAAEIAWFFDGEFVSFLLDGELQVIMGS